jgi:methionine synthase I (cobalamin-dependent)/5,10-methylenetetrahydrofolate reductase
LSKFIIDFINANPYVLADGAMGTYFAEISGMSLDKCELANIEAPNIIRRIHEEYIAAGAQILKTNTFAANTISLATDFNTIKDIIRKGIEIANSAVKGKDIYILGDIGPIPEIEGHNSLLEYKGIIDVFFDSGVRNFILETFSSFNKLLEVCRYIKNKDSSAFILTQFAITPEGFTRKGISGRKIVDIVSNSDLVDAYGFNCLSGPMHLLKYAKSLNISANKDKIISIMPNAGYPTIEKGRTVFINNPEYFAHIMTDMLDNGIKILGGCCGTTPRHIMEMSKALSNSKKTTFYAAKGKKPEFYLDAVENSFKEKLLKGEKVIAVELDPPTNPHIGNMIEGAKSLNTCGADIITIADCPLARARVDSSILAVKLKREANVDVLPHMTCRDRNLNAIKASLLGLHMEGIRNILAVTGDAIPEAERIEIKGVFNFNSYMFIEFINELNHTVFNNNEIFIGGALNINSSNFDIELKRAETKIKKGAKFFLTQPVFGNEAIIELKKIKNTLDTKILGGVLPIVSHRNAIFLNNEIPGIEIPENIIKQFEGKERDEAESLGIKIAVEICREILPYVDGLYIITPFNRWKMVCKIIEDIKTSQQFF